jgi:hypothetical protein
MLAGVGDIGRLLSLCIFALLISLIILLLCSRILLCIFLLLVVRHGTTYDGCGADDGCRAYHCSRHTPSSHYPSASHIKLLSYSRN